MATQIGCDRCSAPLNNKRDIINGELALPSVTNGSLIARISLGPISEDAAPGPDLCQECFLFLFGLAPTGTENPNARLPLALPEGMGMETVIQASQFKNLCIESLHESVASAVMVFCEYARTRENSHDLVDIFHMSDSNQLVVCKRHTRLSLSCLKIGTFSSDTPSWKIHDYLLRYLAALQRILNGRKTG